MGRFLIIFSFTLLLLHSLLPHEHVMAQRQQTLLLGHHSEFSFLEWLTVTISQDLGANHLEEFQNAHHSQELNLQINGQTDIPHFLLSVNDADAYSIFLPVRQPPVPGDIWCCYLTNATYHSRRGPPVA